MGDLERHLMHFTPSLEHVTWEGPARKKSPTDLFYASTLASNTEWNSRGMSWKVSCQDHLSGFIEPCEKTPVLSTLTLWYFNQKLSDCLGMSCMVPSLSIRRSHAQTRTDLVRNYSNLCIWRGSQLDCLSSKPPHLQDHQETYPGPESTGRSL